MMAKASIEQKIIISAELHLLAPLLIGAGVEDNKRKAEADIYVLKNKAGIPYIPGTSIAGVLRSMFEIDEQQTVKYLFGEIFPDTDEKEDIQSAINIDDVLLTDTSISVRDGVSIDSYTKTGIKGHKYNYECVDKGAHGKLSATVTIRTYQEKNCPNLCEQLTKLVNLLASPFRLGAITAKGFGVVQGKEVIADVYDFRDAQAVKQYFLRQPAKKQIIGQQIDDLSSKDLSIKASFAINSSLIVRDQNVDDEMTKNNISAVQLKCKSDYVIPGTSLKGALRHQSEYIFTRLGKDIKQLDGLMGYSDELKKQKSRFIVDESYIKPSPAIIEQAQARNRIDRFTGGTIRSALFAVKPLWQVKKGQPVLEISYTIKDAAEWEVGLALFLLKDLWTGKLPIGGEKAIGRGTLTGIEAKAVYDGQVYQIEQDQQDCTKIVCDKQEALEKFAEALCTLQGGIQ